MGGTFDPIHNGHLICAEEARGQFLLDEVIFIPAGMPWQKQGASSPEDRYVMTVLATASNPGFSVSRIEIDRPGATYTIETLRSLRTFFGEHPRLFFIGGTDAIAEIMTWKLPDMVLAEAHFIAASRPCHELSKPHMELFAGRVSVMQIPGLAISSTQIRRRVAEARPIRYLVAAAVEEYIAERALYRSLS